MFFRKSYRRRETLGGKFSTTRYGGDRRSRKRRDERKRRDNRRKHTHTKRR